MCIFYDDDRGVRGTLLKPKDGFVRYGTGTYKIDKRRAYIGSFPTNLPNKLRVPIAYYAYVKNSIISLDPAALVDSTVKYTATELSTAFEERAFQNLIAGVSNPLGAKMSKLVPVMTIGLVGLSFVITWMVYRKIAALEETITLILGG